MPNRGTLLIVDDEPVNVELLVTLLKADFKIETATSGAEALELAQIVKPDLILLDVMMPTMDGFEVCTRLKSNVGTADIPVIFITARSDAEAEACGLELGASDYVTKPISPPIMLARVRNHIAFKKARDALAASALVDGLTGIANRRCFDEALAVECGRVNRHAGLLSLILFDLDHFKALNDTWGHLAGDECLKKVGVVARAALQRSADIVARYGGEEFVCILP
jgi:PleD family two-component response regulator